MISTNFLNPPQIGKVVFNVEDRAFFAVSISRVWQAWAFSPGEAVQRRLRVRKFNPKCAALTDRALYANRPAHCLHQTLAKSQAKPGSFNFSLLRPQALKWGKESWQLVGSDSGPVVSHGNVRGL